MDESPITVSEGELRKAIAIWITVAPKRIWRDYWNHAETEGKWGASSQPFNRFDPRHAMAEYLADKFKAAGWTVTHPKPPALRSPPAWGEAPLDPPQ